MKIKRLMIGLENAVVGLVKKNDVLALVERTVGSDCASS